MSKIETEKEYFNVVVEILDKIYNLSYEENEKITGIKNKEQPYELKIKEILSTYCFEIKKNKKNDKEEQNKKNKYINIFYEYQPNGSQKPPDYIIYAENYEKIKIECKSSKNNKPVWNCSIPEKNTIYVYYNTKSKKTYIFDGEDIINTKDRLEIIKFSDELKKLCYDFNKTKLCDKNISYYPRQMINQIKNIDEIIIDREKTFNKIKNELLSQSTKVKIEEKKFISLKNASITNSEDKSIFMNYYETPEVQEIMKKQEEELKDILEKEVSKKLLEKYVGLMEKYKPQNSEIIMNVSVKIINELWEKDKSNYISKIYENIENKGKYLNSRKNLLEGNVLEPPKIKYDKENSLIIFENGRHRFSNLRDLGCEKIPIITDKNTKKYLERFEKKNKESETKKVKESGKTNRSISVKSINSESDSDIDIDLDSYSELKLSKKVKK